MALRRARLALCQPAFSHRLRLPPPSARFRETWSDLTFGKQNSSNCGQIVQKTGRSAEQLDDFAVLIPQFKLGSNHMHGIIYLVGLVVVVLAILSFFGLR